LPPHAYEQLQSYLIKFIASDIRPLSVVAGSGFQALCQSLVNFGARYGQFDIKSALPDRSTLARNVPAVVDQTKEIVKEQLAGSEYIAITTDGWTDDYRKVSYVTVTAHYFDTDLNLRSAILNTGPVEEKRTGQILGTVVTKVVEDFRFSINKVTVVTDNAANMIAAFRDKCSRLSCCAHCLNLAVTHMLAIDNAELKNLLSGCKTIVKHFKHTGLQRKLTKTLKQDCPTRWNSTYTMLQSIVEQYDAVKAILVDRKELRYLYDIDKDIG